MEDQKLVNTFLTNRSESAFLKLYRSKTPHLYKMALRLTQDEYQAEELIQEMWIIAIRKLPSFAWRSALKTWLCSILINLFRAKYKAMIHEALTVVELNEENRVEEYTFTHAQDLEAAIANLPPGYRQIIVLYDVEGYKHKEIAEMLDITVGTSKSQLFYARKALRDYLSDDISKR